MAKTTYTLRCHACGHETLCDPGRWVDFGNWIGGQPVSIPCSHCGEQILLPAPQELSTTTQWVLRALIAIIIVSIIAIFRVLIWEYGGI